MDLSDLVKEPGLQTEVCLGDITAMAATVENTLPRYEVEDMEVALRCRMMEATVQVAMAVVLRRRAPMKAGMAALRLLSMARHRTSGMVIGETTAGITGIVRRMRTRLAMSASTSIVRKRRLPRRLAMDCMSGIRRISRKTSWKKYTAMILTAGRSLMTRSMITRSLLLVN